MERGSGRSSVVSGPAILAAVLEAAVDAPARPVGTAAAAYGVCPLIILNPPGCGRPSPAVPGAATLAAVLEAAVDSPTRPVAAAVSVPTLRLLFQMLQLTVYIH